MEDIKKISLERAMAHTKVYAMPEQLKPTSRKIWARAIVEVFKFDCTTSYCLAVNDGNGNPHITHDFGHTSKIMKYVAIYPYDYLSKSDIPEMKKPSDIAIYLIGHGYDKKEIMKLMSDKKADETPKTEEELTADMDIIKKYINKVAVTEYVKRKEMEAEDE